MKKILIIGSTGMAGHTVYNYLYKLKTYELHNISYRNKLNDTTIICDVTNQIELEKKISDLKPDIVINCVGILLKGSKEDAKNAIYINSYLPHFLSTVVSTYGGKLIHLSTDCVFSGKKGGYIESDFRDADDVYGRSKSLGEINNENDLTIRTSIIGPELKQKGEGLFNWITCQSGKVDGFTSVFWSGITTYELAKFIDFSIKNNLTGLVNATNNTKISKFDLLLSIIEVYQLKDIELIPDSKKFVDKSLLNTRVDFTYGFPGYREMIQEQLLKY